jgi:4-amino-4-deoxy-L-arabinose transferase-like glycosyltransferase
LLKPKRWVNLPVVTGILLTLFLVGSTGFWINAAQAQTTQTGSNRFGGMQGPGGPGNGQADQSLIQYLKANQGDYKYLIAVSGSNEASPLIIETGLPVMSLGGFSGRDQIITTAAQVKQLVDSHTVRYFQPGGGMGGGNSVVSQYVQQNCQAVTINQTSASAPTASSSIQNGPQNAARDGLQSRGGFGGQQLYVCGS